MDYKNSGIVNLTHVVLEVLLDAPAGFDSDSDPSLSSVVSTALESSHLRPLVGNQVEDEVNWLTSFGLLEKGRPFRVTQQALDHAKVFRLRPDGTVVVFGSTIDVDAWSTFTQALLAYANALAALDRQIVQLLTPLRSNPPWLDDLTWAVSRLARNIWAFETRIISVETWHKAAVLACREEMLRLRAHKEHLETRARDRASIAGIDRQLAQLQSILDIPDLAGALTTPKPRLTDFVNVGVVEMMREQQQRPPRTPDEKFGILSAPALFSSDFAEVAEGAFARDRSFAVGFIDIDDFKTFNKEHLETVVDQDMLPYFMRALEAYCHGRALAYRQGGDEYLVLLRNADKHEARAFFDGIRAHIADIKYPETVTRNPTVSIGVHMIDGNHEVTVFEAKKLANAAKDMAKKPAVDNVNGKNCVRFSWEHPTPLADPATGLTAEVQADEDPP